MAERGFAIIQGPDLWRRVAYQDTAFEPGEALVRLADEAEPVADEGTPTDLDLAPMLGLAFDPWCRLYVAIPLEGRLLRLASTQPGAQAMELFGPGGPGGIGDFESLADPRAGLITPSALAVDALGRLFIAERAARRLRIFDLVDRRLLRTVPLDAEPMALACAGHQVWLLTDRPERIGRLTATGGPVYDALPEAAQGAEAMTLDHRGRPVLLLGRGRTDALIVPLDHPQRAFQVTNASALAWSGEDQLIVARGPGQALLRYALAQEDRFQLDSLAALRYRGDGIVLDPQGRIGFWSATGFSRASRHRQRFRPSGRVTGFALDSGEFQTQWGRLFVDACIPKGSSVRVHCLALDEAPEGTKPMQLTPPANAPQLTIDHPQLSPPLPPWELIKDVSPEQELHRRGLGPELPWSCRRSDEPFRIYEAPVLAGPGRYLWVSLELSGGARITPRVRGIRAEYPGHDWMRRLPRLYSADPGPAEFLRRYLAMLEGDYHDLELRAAARHMLVDPASAPAEALPWLAGFVGLALDRRWSEAARRVLIAEANWLFRFRGTVAGLKRMLQIYLQGVSGDYEQGHQVEPRIIEHFKVRGLGGAIVGESDALTANSVLGAGFRVGGSLAGPAGETRTVSVNEGDIEESIDKHAHRFTVVLPLLLDQEQRAVVERILDVHRPAHTLYDICSLDSGMRLGISLYAGLTSLIGQGSGFGGLQVGASLLGRSDLVGGLNTPAARTLVGGLRLRLDGDGAPTGRDWRYCPSKGSLDADPETGCAPGESSWGHCHD